MPIGANSYYTNPTYSNTTVVTWVNGANEAYQFPVSLGQSVLLMDRGSSTLYSKSADTSGRITFETYDLVKRVEPAPAEVKEPDLSDYVRNDELEEIINRAINKALQKRNRNFAKQKENE